jgi:hypothetical protein
MKSNESSHCVSTFHVEKSWRVPVRATCKTTDSATADKMALVSRLSFSRSLSLTAFYLSGFIATNNHHHHCSFFVNKPHHYFIIMDYEGQRLSELLFYWIILSFGAVGWIIGYFQQDFTIVFQCWLVGVVISVVVSHYYYYDYDYVS